MENQLNKDLRVAVLWTHLSGYLNACLRELAGRDGLDLLISCSSPSEEAPFESTQFEWCEKKILRQGKPDTRELQSALEKFNPHILIFSGWHISAYRQIARRWRGKSLRVMSIDNCWLGTSKQILGTIIGQQYIRSLAEHVWLPGERQAILARKLGFRERDILRGLYSCNKSIFDQAHRDRIAAGRSVPKSFVFIGRFVEEKGIDTLAKAYRIYRATAENPWPLYCYGKGPQEHLLKAIEGVQVKGFCQPDQMPSALSASGCLILPSEFEPWAVVVHEAASAGLLVLASNRVGAAVHLVQSGFNGFIFDAGNPAELALFMSRISLLSEAEAENMSRASHLLSEQYSPTRWADTILRAHTFWKQDSEELHVANSVKS